MFNKVILAGVSAFAFSALLSFTMAQPAQALTMKECSAKYKAAQAAGTVGNLKWNDFRAKECGTGASAAVDDEQEPPAPTVAAPRGVSFPRAVAAKYSSESAGKARMHTCLDAYNDAKAKGTLAGLKWIQKGGGYYSLCNASLKGM